MKKYPSKESLFRLRHPFAAAFCALAFSASATASDGVWTGGAGNWGDVSNWADGNVANGIGASAVFDTATNGGTVNLGGQTYTIGNLVLKSRLQWNLQNGTIILDAGGSDVPTINVAKSTDWDNQFLNPTLTLQGNNGFVKTGNGKLYIGGSNTYTGVTTVREGILEVGSSNALGSSSGANDYTIVDFTGSQASQLHFRNGVSVDEVFRLRSNGASEGNSLNTYLVSLTGNSVTALNGAIYLDRTGTSTGQHSFRMQSQGNMTVNGNITGHLVDLPAEGSRIDTQLQLNTTASNVMTINGVIADGTLSGRGGLSVSNDGTGKLTLTAANTYSGGTLLRGTTTLFVNNTTGSGTGTGSLDAGSGTRLRGNGIIAPTKGGIVFQSGATVLPGNGVNAGEKLTFDLAGIQDSQYIVDFNAGAKIGIDISSAEGASYLVFSGLSFVDQVVFNNNVVDFSILGGQVLADGLYTLATFSGQGSYAGSWVLGSGLESYSDVELIYSDNSIQLRVGVIPEPSTVAAFIGGGALLAAMVIRRRRKA